MKFPVWNIDYKKFTLYLNHAGFRCEVSWSKRHGYMGTVNGVIVYMGKDKFPWNAKKECMSFVADIYDHVLASA